MQTNHQPCDNTRMDLIAIFHDYTEDGHPLIAIHDEDENYLFSVTIPVSFVEQHELQIGDEFRITPSHSS